MSRNYLEAFVVIIVAAAIAFFLVRPKFDEAQDLARQVEEKTEEIKNQRDYYDKLRAAKENLDRYAENFQKIDTALPEEADAPAVMNFLQAAAMQAGLVIKTVDYKGGGTISKDDSAGGGESAGGVVLKQYGITASLAGSYADLKSFLSIVERSSRLIAVESIDLKSDTESKEGGEVVEKKKTKDDFDKTINYDIKFSANYYDRQQ
jgi:Tfp pilus assembly protein PilO